MLIRGRVADRYKGQGTPMKSQPLGEMSPVAYAWIYHCNRCGNEVWFRHLGDLHERPHDCSDMPRSEEPRTVTSHRR